MTEESLSPSVDAVIVSVTFNIERDYEERGVFPELRAVNAAVRHSSSSLHYMTEASVKPILEDAKRRVEVVRKGMLVAYRAHIRGLEIAIKEAKQRRANFAAPKAVCIDRHEGYSERWRGTKEQLQAIGIQLAGPWPGEEGGKDRRAKGRDARGRDAFITIHSRTWRGLFEVQIEYPDHERKSAMSAQQREQKRRDALAGLSVMPKDEDDFRQRMIENVRFYISVAARGDLKHHGYGLTEDGREAIMMSADAVVEAILQAEVTFDEKRHREIEFQHRKELAEADGSFQNVMNDLRLLRPEILEGSAP